MTAFTDALNHPDLKRIFLAEVTAGQHLRLWTLDGTNSPTSTYYATAPYKVTSVSQNGTALTERASVALVNSNAGSYYYDSTNNRVYVHTTGSVDPHGVTIQATVAFYYATHPKAFNSAFYEPRIDDIPSLSIRIEERFTGVSQIGGGSIILSNADGYFDGMTDLQWDSGTVALKTGIDRPQISSVMAYSDYQTMGTWIIKDWAKNDKSFTLNLVEYKIKLKKKIPLTFYERNDYPFMEQTYVGQPIPVAYGRIKGAKAVPVDIQTRKFKIAGHAIKQFEQVRVKSEDTGAWDIKSFETTDEANGEFTLSATDWSYNLDVAVDFKGKKTAGGDLMDNASDVVKDILTSVIAEPSANIDTTSFTNAFNELDLGTIGLFNDPYTSKAIGLYINEVKSAEDYLSDINFSVGSYLFANSTGQYFYKVFVPSKSEGLTSFGTDEISDFQEVTNNDNIYSRAVVYYDRRHAREWAELRVVEKASAQYLHNEDEARIITKNSVLSETDDAQYTAEQTLNYEGRPSKTYQITVPGRKTLTMLPGDFVIINYPRHSINGVFEVLGISHQLIGDKTSLVLGNMHGLEDEPGWWVSDTPTFPSRVAAETGYGSGTMTPWDSGWSDTLKAYARQNCGYWTDDNGYADSTDPDSFIPSTWI